MLAAEAGFWDWNVPAEEFYVSPKLIEMADFPPGTNSPVGAISWRAHFSTPTTGRSGSAR